MAGTDDEGIQDLDSPLEDDEAPPELHPRLIDPGDEDVDTIDVEKDAVGSLVDDEGGLSAEEAAMHITEEP